MSAPTSTVSTRSSVHALLAVGAALLLLLAPVLTQIASASTEFRSYSIRYQTTDHGSIALIGNTQMTCPAANAACPAAQDGTAAGDPANNNNYAMIPVDVDGDAATSNSSTAALALPAGATVLFAGLYWGAKSADSARDEVSFSIPGSGYATVTAASIDASGTDAYAAFADVTTLVQSNTDPDGDYAVADMQVTAEANGFGGWSLIVAYQDAGQPLRNLTVFDGYVVVNSTAPDFITTTVSGFLTPVSGTVNAEVGMVAAEGDLGFNGDRFQIDGADVSDVLNPADNVFNSTISNVGATVTAKTPNYVNQLGWDVDLLDVTGMVANSATSADLTFTTGGETYYPQALTFAVDVFEPRLDATKSGTDVNGGSLLPGDEIAYEIDVTNSGTDPASDVVLTDPIPAATTYVPGSLEIVSGANAGPLTDVAGDDQGELAGGAVVVRLGTGADATDGGTLGIGATTTVGFRVTVDSGTPGSTTIENQANLAYTGATLGTSFTGQSDSDSGANGDQPHDLVTAAASAPVAVDDSATVAEDDSVVIDVVGNDTDPDGDIDPTTVTVTSGPANGTVTIDPVTGAITYTPDPDFNGSDSFTYQVCDATGLCDTATVDVDVTAGGDPPVAVDDSATVAEDDSVVIDVVGNDTDPDGDIDPTTVTVTSGPAHGSVTVDPVTGAITYTPDPDFNGTDSFMYQVCDSTGLCDTATVDVDVTAVDDPPVAVDDSATVAENGSVVIPVVGNDSDPDGNLDPGTVVVTSGPAHGTVSIDPTTGAITYTPDPGYSGPDSFTYQVCDATGLCDTATVSITVVAVPDTAGLLGAVPAAPSGGPPWIAIGLGLVSLMTLIVSGLALHHRQARSEGRRPAQARRTRGR